MSQETIYIWTCEIMKIINLYLIKKNVSTKTYQRGLNEIDRTLKSCLSKIEHIYYTYILYPDLVCYSH